jgi:hypothetical protein
LTNEDGQGEEGKYQNEELKLGKKFFNSHNAISVVMNRKCKSFRDRQGTDQIVCICEILERESGKQWNST